MNFVDTTYSYHGGAIEISKLTFANITKCYFKGNKASGSGGAIYVTMKSELTVHDSLFTQNTASSGGSVAVVVGECLIESCEFVSNNASETGGCIAFDAANGTVKQSHFSGCQGKYGGTVVVTEESIMQIEAVTISKSHSTDNGGALQISYNSNLLVKNSVITDSRSDHYGGGIYCSDRSQMYLDSVLISSCSAGYGWSGCVRSYSCNVTMDNITITNVSRARSAINASDSTINIYNTMTQSVSGWFLRDDSSHVSFWNFNMSGTSVVLKDSIAEFRHTLFTRQDETCPIRRNSGSSIDLKSVYITGPKNRLVCDYWTHDPVLHGNVSGRALTFTLIPVKNR